MNIPEKIDRRKVRRADTKAVILDAALALFAHRGVTATSVDDIAAKAGIAKGSIYYNFGSKETLAQELMVHHITRLHDSIQAAAATASGAAGRRAIVAALLSEMEAHPDVAQLMVSQMFRANQSWIEGVAKWRSTVTDPLTSNLVAERGEEFRQQAEIQATAIVGGTLAAGLDWLVFRPELPREVVVNTLLELADSQ